MELPVAPGEVLLGKYRIERVLGKGGMGIVVAARHIELGQLFAIKFLLPSVLDDEEIVARFAREARAASQLRSEHIARVHDFGRMDDGAPYMVMEYLDGCDVKALLAKEGPLPADVAMTYLAQACDAMAEAHAAGIVHRDLKPANLFLVRRRNGSPCIKVVDFGISKHLSTQGIDLTRSNAMVGSPLYMSPEQITMSKAVDARSDIWALGVILYELLTGTSPFKCSGGTFAAITHIMQDEPPPIRERRPDVPARAEMVIARCLKKDREDRFQRVEDLLAVLEGQDAPTQSSSLPATTTKMVAVAVDRVPADPSAITAIQQTVLERTPVAFGEVKPEPARRHISSGVLAAGAIACVALIGGTLAAARMVLAPSRESTAQAGLSAIVTSVAPNESAALPTQPSSPSEDAGVPDAEPPNAMASAPPSALKNPNPQAPATRTPLQGSDPTKKKKTDGDAYLTR